MKQLPYIDEAESHEMITNIHYKSDVVGYSVLTAEGFAGERPYAGEEGVRWAVEEQEEGEGKRGEEGEEDSQSQGVDKDEEQDKGENNEEQEDQDSQMINAEEEEQDDDDT
jgi:hypothetical protein